MDPLGFTRHDHESCIAGGLSAAEALCAEQGLALTPQRRRVLEILLQEHRAMGAYELLDALREGGQSAQPPTVYRALDFLVSHGLAHKIERLNAFIACAHPGETHAPGFLICRLCGTVAEMPSRRVIRALRAAAEPLGFAIEKAVVEAEGLCPACQDKEAA